MVLWLNKKKKEQEALESMKAKIQEIVASHLHVLTRRRFQTIKIDAYGVPNFDAWQKEVQYFFDKVILPKLTDEERVAIVKTGSAGMGQLVTQLIERPAQLECKRIEETVQYNDSMSPLEYERYCAILLQNAGWDCTFTKASGDQGADVIAKKGSQIMIVQCKKYGSSVGNGAVQEVISAKNFNHAHHAVVVTNSTFTKSAKELADVTGVMLLNHTDLLDIDKLIS